MRTTVITLLAVLLLAAACGNTDDGDTSAGAAPTDDTAADGGDEADEGTGGGAPADGESADGAGTDDGAAADGEAAADDGTSGDDDPAAEGGTGGDDDPAAEGGTGGGDDPAAEGGTGGGDEPAADGGAGGGDDPAADGGAGSVSADVMAAALEQLVTEDNTFGGGPPPFSRYLVQSSTDPAAGDGSATGLPARPLTEAEQAAVGAVLEPFGPVEFIDDPDEWRTPDLMPTVEGAVILGVGEPEIDGDSALVPVSLWCGGLCGTWLTYRIDLVDDAWTVSGVEGPIAIS